MLGAGSLVFGHDIGGGLIGDFSLAGFANLSHPLPGFAGLGASPLSVMVFQMMFAIITAALISGGTTDRIKFLSYTLLIGIWLVVVYAPVAHWVFSPQGWLAKRGVLDFAGGTVVEICSGFSTLAVVLVLGQRRGWRKESMAPHSVPLSLLGVGILWFGWFGFNAGSSLSFNSVAVHAFVNVQVTAAAGMVAVTPCAGFVTTMAAIGIGLAAGVVCAWAVRLKFRLGYRCA